MSRRHRDVLGVIAIVAAGRAAWLAIEARTWPGAVFLAAATAGWFLIAKEWFDADPGPSRYWVAITWISGGAVVADWIATVLR